MGSFDKEMMSPVTAQEMVDTYNNALQVMETAYALLEEAEEKLRLAFTRTDQDNSYRYSSFNLIPGRYGYDSIKKDIAKGLKKRAWTNIIAMTGIRKLLSTKRADILDKKIEDGEMEDVSIGAIFDILLLLQGQTNQLASEVVIEAFELIRPRRSGYKNNEKFQNEIGKKVILHWIELYGWSSEYPFRVNYYRAENIRVLDRAFSILAGHKISEAYDSQLAVAINTSPDGKGETEFFKFKCYQNGNIHIDFKRMDLVKEMNRLASENTLKPANIEKEF